MYKYRSWIRDTDIAVLMKLYPHCNIYFWKKVFVFEVIPVQRLRQVDQAAFLSFHLVIFYQTWHYSYCCISLTVSKLWYFLKTVICFFIFFVWHSFWIEIVLRSLQYRSKLKRFFYISPFLILQAYSCFNVFLECSFGANRWSKSTIVR